MKKSFFYVFTLACTLFLQSISFAVDKSTYMTSDGNCTAAKVVYEYKPDSLFQLDTQMGYVSDIQLKPGEKVQYIGAGDTKRWLIDQSTVGTTTHIYVKPLAAGINTNMIINTDQRTYRFYVVSVSKNYTPIVQFSFPDEAFKKMIQKPLPWKTKEEKTFFDIYTVKRGNTYVPKKISRGYEIKKHGNISSALLPEEIFDDGTRTYIKMPASNKYDMPVLYNIQDKKPSLVNYRIRDAYIIADRVFEEARLYYSPKRYLTITPSKNVYEGGEYHG